MNQPHFKRHPKQYCVRWTCFTAPPSSCHWGSFGGFAGLVGCPSLAQRSRSPGKDRLVSGFQQGASWNSNGFSLTWCCWCINASQAPVVQCFLTKITICSSTMFNQEEITAFLTADQGHEEIVKALLLCAADANVANCNDNTPLWVASWNLSLLVFP